MTRKARMALLASLVTAAITSAAAAAPIGPMSQMPAAESGVTLVQSRVCRSCRNYCYNEYRRFCGYSERCRAAFTSCMRDCWYQACR